MLGGDTNRPAEEIHGTPARPATSGAIWRVRGLVRLTDGRIAVLLSEDRQLLLFSPSGNLAKTIGRKGEGPGEFYRPRHMRYLPPDTLMVWDEWMGPVTSFDTTGRVLERRTIDLGRALERLPEGAGVESPIVPLPDGSFVVEIKVGSPESEPPKAGTLVRHPSMRYVRLDEAYTTVDLGSWPGPDHFVVPESLSSRSPPSARQFLSSRNSLFQISVVNAQIRPGAPGVATELDSIPDDGESGRLVGTPDRGSGAQKALLPGVRRPDRGYRRPFVGQGMVRLGDRLAGSVERLQSGRTMARGPPRTAERDGIDRLGFAVLVR